jgi:predicted phosphodiesterase
MQKVLFVPDTHRPYHDKLAWGVFLRAAKAFKPDIIIVLGDFIDCAAVSFYSRDPRAPRLKQEIEDAAHGLRELENLGAGRHIYIEGNHEERLPRYLKDRAPEIFELLDLKSLLGLTPKWEYVPYREFFSIGKAIVTHDLEKSGRNANEQALNDAQGNVVIGHTHAMNVAYRGNARGKTHVGAMFGWLGDRAKIDYRHKLLANRYWMTGFGTGYIEAGGVLHIVPVPIINYHCVVEGKLIK